MRSQKILRSGAALLATALLALAWLPAAAASSVAVNEYLPVGYPNNQATYGPFNPCGLTDITLTGGFYVTGTEQVANGVVTSVKLAFYAILSTADGSYTTSYVPRYGGTQYSKYSWLGPPTSDTGDLYFAVWKGSDSHGGQGDQAFVLKVRFDIYTYPVLDQRDGKVHYVNFSPPCWDSQTCTYGFDGWNCP